MGIDKKNLRFCKLTEYKIGHFKSGLSGVTHKSHERLKAGDYDASVPAAIATQLPFLVNHHRSGVNYQVLRRGMIVFDISSELLYIQAMPAIDVSDLKVGCDIKLGVQR